MQISQINKQILKQMNDTTFSFKPGQIVKGKIIKLFPEQNAEILLGNQRIIAKLEAALQVGKIYLFQVQNNDKIHHLKVIQEANLETEKQVKQLLDRLNLKGNKVQKQLLRQLLNKNIPFDRNELQQAFSFLTKGLDSKLATNLLREMFQQQLPIKEQIFTTLYQKSTRNLVVAVKNLQASLNDKITHSATEGQLLKFLNRFMDNGSQIKNQSEFSIKNQGPIITNLLYQLDIISENEQRLINRELTLHNLIKIVENNEILPLYRGNLTTFLSKIIENNKQLFVASKENIKLFRQQLSPGLMVEESLNLKGYQQLIRNFENKILKNLPKLTDESLLKLNGSNPQSIERIMNLLTALENTETYDRLKEFINLKEQYDYDLIKRNFKEQLGRYFQIVGLSNEVIDQNHPMNAKQMLTQLLQSENNGIYRSAYVLAQQMQGIQLTTVNETQSFIHVSLELPGSLFNVPKNMGIEFTGHKTENGGLNTEYCRIVFFLELEQLSSTVIDMNVQKRIITITIYNNHEEIEKLGQKFEGILQTRLTEMDYQISSIRYRKYSKTNKTEEESLLSETRIPQKGVDFKI